ncbi:MAG: hypothetical protein HKN41_09635, partial [Ilumatobacter sp.]|nr:hypothetical protein [Ilumatobacter sp.]
MRSGIRCSLAAAGALVALTVPAVAAADPPTTEQMRDLEVIEIDCEVRTSHSRLATHCRWSEPTSPRAAAVKLFRLDPEVDRYR